MKRLTVIALLASAIAFTGCKKKDEGNKPATTENKPAAGTAAPAAGTAAPAAGTAAPAAGTAAPAAGTAAPADPAAGTAAPAGGAAMPSDAEFEAMMNKALGLFEGMAKAVDAAGDDCGKLADGMAKVLDDSKDFIESAKKWKDNADMDKKAKAWFESKQEAMMPNMMKIGMASQKCGSDAKFTEVMKRLEEMN